MRWWLLAGIGVGLFAGMLEAQPRNDTRAVASIVLDANSGAVLQGMNLDEVVPAGKLHQWLVLLAAQDQALLGILPLDAPIALSQETVRAFAEKGRPGLSFDPSRTYLLSDVLKAVALTGSDLATVVAAEAMWGEREAALEALNEYSRRVGLKQSRFVSWRSDDPKNETTVRDTAAVAMRLTRSGSLAREWMSLAAFPFDDGRLVVANRIAVPGARFAWSYVDRVAEGSRQAVRLAAAAVERDDLRLLAVVLGHSVASKALEELVQLLAEAEAEYELVSVVRSGEPLQVEVEVEGGRVAKVVPIAGQTFRFPIRRGASRTGLQVRYQLPSTVIAPVNRGEVLGEVIVEFEGSILSVIPAVSPVTIEGSGLRSAHAGSARSTVSGR